METYDRVTDPSGPAMTWGIHSILYRDIGEEEKAAHYFRIGFNVFAYPPFYTWHEGNHTDGMGGGAPNLVTGAGGFLQSVWAGYGGGRFERAGELTLRQPAPLPDSTLLRLRGVHFLGARLDITAHTDGWSVGLSAASPSGALALVVAAEGGGAVAELTKGANVRFRKGVTAHVREKSGR